MPWIGSASSRLPLAVPTGMRPGMRNTLIAVAICLAGLGMAIALDNITGPPTNRALADALAVGG